MTEKRTLEQVKEFAEALQNEAKREGRPSHPHGDTLEEIVAAWQAERDVLVGILENILETCDSGRDAEWSLEGVRMDVEYGLRMIKGDQE